MVPIFANISDTSKAASGGNLHRHGKVDRLMAGCTRGTQPGIRQRFLTVSHSLYVPGVGTAGDLTQQQNRPDMPKTKKGDAPLKAADFDVFSQLGDGLFHHRPHVLGVVLDVRLVHQRHAHLALGDAALHNHGSGDTSSLGENV